MSFRLPRFMQAVVIGMSLAAVSAVEAAPAQADATPTIRAMSGAKQLDHLDPKTTALVVIDFQKEYFSGKMPIPDGKKAMANTQKLIKFADAAKIPVYQVQHIAPAGSAVFAIDGDTVKFQPGMEPRAHDKTVQKTTVSVFASTDLDKQLKAANIKTIIVAGLMTHACVAGAARDAVPLGYQVVVASDASATRSIKRANGSTIDSATLHRASLAEIEDTFGDVMTTSEITKLPLR
ncbi:cysteine hydrolase family protein [Burkholderia cenocepacia]|uniref:cysteine hydrolase family protein n=1 Tax=Burkholderia cepacia complex TaxID=87882 RepID=UPI003B28C55B